MAKKDIRSLSYSKLKEALVGMGEKAFRAKQIEEWLWMKGAGSFHEMSNQFFSVCTIHSLSA